MWMGLRQRIFLMFRQLPILGSEDVLATLSDQGRRVISATWVHRVSLGVTRDVRSLNLMSVQAKVAI